MFIRSSDGMLPFGLFSQKSIPIFTHNRISNLPLLLVKHKPANVGSIALKRQAGREEIDPAGNRTIAHPRSISTCTDHSAIRPETLNLAML